MKVKMYQKTNWTKFTVNTIIKSFFLSLIIAIVFGFAFGYNYLNVTSSSMSPTINKDAIIVIKDMPFESIEIGDIVTYKKIGSTTNVTHRVAGFDSVTGGLILRTEPDWIEYGEIGTIAINESSDRPTSSDPASPILEEEVVGVVVGYANGLGTVFNFIKANKIIITIGLVLLLFVISFV